MAPEVMCHLRRSLQLENANMPWTLSQYIADNYAQVASQTVPGLCTLGGAPNPYAGATGLIPDWVAHVTTEYLNGVPHPGRAGFIQTFAQHVQSRTMACLQNNTGTIAFIQMMDETARDDLDAQEAARIAATPAPGPTIPHDPQYLTPGVVCTGSPIGLNNQTVAPWPNRDAFSANHGQGNSFRYRQGGGGSGAVTLAFVVPPANVNMIREAKPNITLVPLLGDARHAEDGWFARFYGDFVAAVNALQPGVALPALAGRSLWQQKATVPRVEFLMSMSPCPRNDANNQEGCAVYFSKLRRDITANVPIIIYYYRIWLAAQVGRGVQTVDGAGNIVQQPNVWA
jgi:hypothetical protein